MKQVLDHISVHWQQGKCHLSHTTALPLREIPVATCTYGQLTTCGHRAVAAFHPTACGCTMSTEKELIRADKLCVFAPLPNWYFPQVSCSFIEWYLRELLTHSLIVSHYIDMLWWVNCVMCWTPASNVRLGVSGNCATHCSVKRQNHPARHLCTGIIPVEHLKYAIIFKVLIGNS